MVEMRWGSPTESKEPPPTSTINARAGVPRPRPGRDRHKDPEPLDRKTVRGYVEHYQLRFPVAVNPPAGRPAQRLVVVLVGCGQKEHPAAVGQRRLENHLATVIVDRAGGRRDEGRRWENELRRGQLEDRANARVHRSLWRSSPREVRLSSQLVDACRWTCARAHPAVLVGGPGLGPDPIQPQLLHQQGRGAEFGKAPKDVGIFASAGFTTSRRSRNVVAQPGHRPNHMRLRLEAAILSRIRSPVASRSNWAALEPARIDAYLGTIGANPRSFRSTRHSWRSGAVRLSASALIEKGLRPLATAIPAIFATQLGNRREW